MSQETVTVTPHQTAEDLYRLIAAAVAEDRGGSSAEFSGLLAELINDTQRAAALVMVLGRQFVVFAKMGNTDLNGLLNKLEEQAR